MQLGTVGLFLLIVAVDMNESARTMKREVLTTANFKISREKRSEVPRSYSNITNHNTEQRVNGSSIYGEKSRTTAKPEVTSDTTSSYYSITLPTELRELREDFHSSDMPLPRINSHKIISNLNPAASSTTSVSSRKDMNSKASELHAAESELEFNNFNKGLIAKYEYFGDFPSYEPRSSSKTSQTCRHIGSTTKSFCPEDFTIASNTHCIRVLENQPFPPACPYPHYSPYDEIEKYIDKYLKSMSTWLQVFRNTSSGFPDFEWIENGPLYGKTYTGNISNLNEVRDKNCLVRRNSTVYRVSCSEKHTAICVYSFANIITSPAAKVCQNEQYNYCIFAHYDLTKPTCFCQALNSFQPPKYNFCEKLAEPVLPFQTHLLIAAEAKFAKIGSKCWIGMHKEDHTQEYKWSSTNTDVNYTQWAIPYNCKLSEGALQFGKYDFGGWTLVKDRTLGCAICQTQAPFKEPRLLFFRGFPGDPIDLHVGNLPTVTRFHNVYDIYCFSDDNDDSLKTVKFVNYVQHSPDNYYFELYLAEDRPSHYWCEAFQFPSFSVARSEVLVNYWMFEYIHEFSIHVGIYIPFPYYDPFINNIHIKLCELLRNRTELYFGSVISVRPMRAYFNETTYYMNMTTHLTLKRTPKTATQEYIKLLTALRNLTMVKGVYNCQICPLEITVTPNGDVLEWPETRIGVTTIPNNILCLDEERNMSPVTRKCEGDFLHGSKWGDPLGTCYRNSTYSETTEVLFDLLHQNVSAENLTANLLKITQEYVDTKSIDVFLIAKNLEKLFKMSEDQIDGSRYSRIISNIMYFDNDTLNEAQIILNSTDIILSTLESFLNNKNASIIVSPRLITQIIDLRDSDIMGIGLYKKTPEASSFEQYTLSLLYRNSSLENVTRNEQLEVAALFPSEILRKNRTKKLVTTVFYNDYLFNAKHRGYDIAKIISISVPGVIGLLQHPIQIIFKMPEYYSKHRLCSFWQYGIDSLSVSVPGKWHIEGPSARRFGVFEICEFYHMTHFGHLLKHKLNDHDRPLEIITAVGSLMSLIGVIPIYCTAIFFKNWRKRPGNIILINFCLAVTMQVTSTFLMYGVKKDGMLCKTVGILLHYSVLSEFCWMLVVAILQYKRYVAVFKPRNVNIVKKSLLMGWGIPLLPVVTTLCISPINYVLNEQTFCYLTGYYFTFGLILPITVILSINTFIFVLIVYNISQSSTAACIELNRNYKREILLAFLLFFILGISWIFGLLGTLGAGVWCSYVFCIAATLRGLVLFLYFISGNKETRNLWNKRFSYFISIQLLYLKIKHRIMK